MLPSTDSPFQQFYDLDGSPLDEGYVYIGAVDLNPETAQSPVFWDVDGTQPAVQPIRTLNGYPVRSGTPAVLYTPSIYSVTVRNKARSLVFYAPDSSEYSSKFFKFNATGSVPRPIGDKLSDFLCVKDFGAIGDGVADDTAAIQRAIDFAGIGRTIFFPRGTYLYSGVTIGSGANCRFEGESTQSVFLLLTSATAIGFDIASDLAVSFENMTLGYKAGVVGTAGAFIKLSGVTFGNVNSKFTNVGFNEAWVGLLTASAYLWTVDRCSFSEAKQYGVHVQNTLFPDNGDSAITRSVFSSAQPCTHIIQRSSGGLRLDNNKFLGGQVAYQLFLDNAVNTSDFLATGNSVENFTVAGFDFRRTGPTGTFSHITITGNQFAGGPSPLNFASVTAGWLTGITITGNSVETQGGPALTLNAVSNFSVAGNQFKGALGTEVGIQIGALSAQGIVGVNTYETLNPPYTNSSNTVTTTPKMYSSSVAVNSNAAVGGLFTGSAAFSVPAGVFNSVPKYFCTVSVGNNGIAANAVSPTVTGCTVTAFSTASQNLSINVVAMADY